MSRFPPGSADGTLSALGQASKYITHLIEFRFDSGSLFHTTAHKDLSWSGNVYKASSDILKFGDVSETEKLEISSMSFTVSGVNQANVATMLTENVVDRKILLLRAVLDLNTYDVIPSPQTIYVGRIKSVQLREVPGGESVITYSTGSVLSDFSRTAGRRTNTQDQEIYLAFKGYPPTKKDLGFEFAHKVVRDIPWGRK